MKPLNINIFVDVIALLAGNPEERTVFLFDDSPDNRVDVGQGTPHLRTPVWPGQRIRWSVVPVDTQTMIWLAGVSFEIPARSAPASSKTEGETVPPSPAEEKGPAAGMVAAVNCDNGRSSPPSVPHPVWARHWEGYVPCGLPPGMIFPYRLDFQFGALTGRTISIDGPALLTLPVAPPLPVCWESIS